MERRVAIYAEHDDDIPKLKAYVQGRGWSCWGRAYHGREWKTLIADSRGGTFHAICASFDGYRWFAALTPEVDFERVLPKIGSPKASRKGHVLIDLAAIIQHAIGMIREQGPRTAEEVGVFSRWQSVRPPGRYLRSETPPCGATGIRVLPDVWLKDDYHRRWKLTKQADLVTLPPREVPQDDAFTRLVDAVADALAKRAGVDLLPEPPRLLTPRIA